MLGEVLGGRDIGKHVMRAHVADGDPVALDQLAKEEEEAKSDVFGP